MTVIPDAKKNPEKIKWFQPDKDLKIKYRKYLFAYITKPSISIPMTRTLMTVPTTIGIFPDCCSENIRVLIVITFSMVSVFTF